MSGLEHLLEQATPGPWGDRLVPPFTQPPGERVYMNQADVALIALAPDMARLLIDMAAWIDEILTKPYRVEERWNAGNDLIRRKAALNQKAGTA